LAFVAIAIACGGGSSPAPTATDLAKKPKVVCTIGMIADIAGRIAENDLEVEALMGPGIDPHLYKASEGDASNSF
jgi:manganese/zinc/iron transport system substrate-binding protein